MNYEYLQSLRKNHSAWRLMNADSAPLIISFFNMTFMEKGIRPLKESELAEKLDNYLFHVRRIHGEDIYPKAAKEYLEDWASGQNAYLRKYYPRLGDEPEFDITPATERVIEWIKSIEKREFVGTESRLLLIFQMLRELTNATEVNPEVRIAELNKQKEQIDQEIAKIEAGLATNYDERQIKENYWRIDEESRHLLSDFREVEENFRILDRQTREKITTSTTGKAELLDEIFNEQDAIEQSDQGKSFKAFWAFLMSQKRKEELEQLIQKILGLKELDGVGDSTVSNLQYNLLDAGEKVKKTLSNLNEQLRRFLDEKIWLENKRIMELIQKIEQKTIELRLSPPTEKDFIQIDDLRPTIELPMTRRLFVPPDKPFIPDMALLPGNANIDTTILYNQHSIDEAVLINNIKKVLHEKKQVSLGELCGIFPITKGLSELIAYMVIASKDKRSYIDTAANQEIMYQDKGISKQARVPLVLYTR